MWFLPLMKASLRQAVLNLACEYGNAFLPSELTESSRHSQLKYSQPICRPLSFRHLHPIMKSSGVCWTPSLRTFSVTNWKSRGGDVSSIALTTDTFFSTERFSVKVRRHCIGDGCSGGIMTAGAALRDRISGFDKCDCDVFSFLPRLLTLETIEVLFWYLDIQRRYRQKIIARLRGRI